MSIREEFKLDLEGDLAEEAVKAARAADMLADKLRLLGASEDKATKRTIALARAQEQLARSKYEAVRAFNQKAPADKWLMNVSRANVRAARSQSLLNKAQDDMVHASPKLAGVASGLKMIGAALAVVGPAYLAARAGAFAFQQALDLTKNVVQMQMFAENTELAFSNLLGSKAAGKQAFAETTALAVELGQGLTETGDRMKKLLAQQFSLEEAKGLVKMVADLRTIGVEGEKADRVLLALTQIRSKGRLQAQEMLQLAEAGVSLELVYKHLGKSLGKSRDDLRKMQEAGKITSADALAAVQAATLEKVNKTQAGEAGREFADTMLTGMFDRLGSAKDLFLLSIGKGFDKRAVGKLLTGFSGKLGDLTLQGGFVRGFERLSSSIEKLSPDTIEAFGAGLKIAGEAFEKVIFLGTNFAEGMMTAVTPALKELAGTGFGNIEGLGQFAAVAGKEFGLLLVDVIAFGKTAIPVLDRVATVAGQILTYLQPDKATTEQAGNSVLWNYVRGVTAVTTLGVSEALYAAGKWIAGQLTAGTKDGLQQHSPSKVGMGIGLNFDKSIGMGLQKKGFAAAASYGIAADMGSAFSMPTARASFGSSPAAKAMASSKSNVNFRQQNNFAISEASSGRATASLTAAAVFDFSMSAKSRFSVAGA